MKPPCISGTWSIKGKTLFYENPDVKKVTRQTVSFDKVFIEQRGKFFLYRAEGDPRLPKLGVFEAVYLNAEFAGWKAHMVDTNFDNDRFIFNFTKIEKNKVLEFDIVYTESGFSKTVAEQTPRVQYAKAKRVSC